RVNLGEEGVVAGAARVNVRSDLQAGRGGRRGGGDDGHGARLPSAATRLSVRRSASSTFVIVAASPSLLASPDAAAWDTTDAAAGAARNCTATLRTAASRAASERSSFAEAMPLQVGDRRVVGVGKNPARAEVEAPARFIGAARRRMLKGLAGGGLGGVEPSVQRGRARERQHKISATVGREARRGVGCWVRRSARWPTLARPSWLGCAQVIAEPQKAGVCWFGRLLPKPLAGS